MLIKSVELLKYDMTFLFEAGAAFLGMLKRFALGQ